jgi:hypothetical protein
MGDFTREDLLQWLECQSPERIREVVAALGEDPDCPNIELDLEPGALLAQFEGDFPTAERLEQAIEDALGLDQAKLSRELDYRENEPEELPPELESEPETDDEEDA